VARGAVPAAIGYSGTIMTIGKRIVLAASLSAAVLPAAAAQSGRMDAMLRRLEPETRFEQVCDIALMARIQADSSPYRPDRVVGGALEPPHHDGDVLTGRGAALRSGGQWYRLSFECRTTPDHMRVLDLTYRIGDAIPEESWGDYGLWR
jgi:hypothetical protein